MPHPSWEEKRAKWLAEVLEEDRKKVKHAKFMQDAVERARVRELKRLQVLEDAKVKVREDKRDAELAAFRQKKLIEHLANREVTKLQVRWAAQRRTICSIELHPHEKEP